MNKTILIVEDDEKLVKILKLYFEKDGYKVISAHDGVEGLRLFRQRKPDLVVLDLMLPKMNGEKVCQRIRQDWDTPIIMLTAKTKESNKIDGLDLGADDYVTKPFSRGELLARVRAVLRRAESSEEPYRVTFNNLTVNFRQMEVTLGSEKVDLTKTEYNLLKTMIKQPGTVFTRVQLIHSVFGYGYEGLQRTIDTHINNLRKKIESDPQHPSFIKTVFGTGYKFNPDPHEH